MSALRPLRVRVPWRNSQDFGCWHVLARRGGGIANIGATGEKSAKAIRLDPRGVVVGRSHALQWCWGDKTFSTGCGESAAEREHA